MSLLLLDLVNFTSLFALPETSDVKTISTEVCYSNTFKAKVCSGIASNISYLKIYGTLPLSGMPE